MSDSSPNIDSRSVQQKSLLVMLGLVVGFVLSIFSYFIFTVMGPSQQDTSSKNSLENTPVFLDDSDALLERLAFEKTSSTDFCTSDLRKISEDLQTFSAEELFKALRRSAALPYTKSKHPVQEMLCEYLVEKSPSKALESIWLFEEHRKVALLRIVVRHWVVQDWEESFKQASGLRHPYREIALETILGELDLTDEMLSSLTSSNGVEIGALLAEQMHELKIYESINQDPSAAFDLLRTDNVEDSEQADLFSQVLNELFQVEGIEALNRLNFIRYNSEFYNELFVQIAAQDRVGTLDYIESLSRFQRPRLMYPLMENWVEVDVDNALETIRNLPNPTLRSYTYTTLVSVWGWTRPREVLERLQDIPREHRSSGVLNAVRTLGATNPDEILRLLPSLEAIPGAFNHEVERTFVYSWSSKLPDQALKWVQENVEPESLQRDLMLNRVLGEYALVQPKTAMEVAITEDPNPSRGELGLAYSVIDSLVRSNQIDTAFGLLDQVPQNTRAFTYADVAVKLVLEERFNDVISLSETLSATDKVNYFRSVARGLSGNNSSEVLTMVAKIPGSRVRSAVVNRILSDEWSTERYYTEEQLEALRSFLAE